VNHTTQGALGTVFHHNGDYSGDVTVIPVSFPERRDGPDGAISFSVDIPFEDLRQLVLGYLRDRRIEHLEQISDDELEAELLR
jgi:hypothetical protein